MKRFKKIKASGDSAEELNLIQDNIATALDSLVDLQTLDSVIIRGQKLLAAGTTTVNHKLRRKLSGWKIVRKSAQSDVWDTQDTNKSPELTLTLRCSANVTVDLEVF